jgi:hypothetical protein
MKERRKWELGYGLWVCLAKWAGVGAEAGAGAGAGAGAEAGGWGLRLIL